MRQQLFIFLILTLSGLSSQTDSLNKFNLKGKKNGFWVQYLDSNANPVDKSHYRYLGFEYYENGKALFHFKRYSWKTKEILIYEKDSCSMTEMLSGLFKWFDPKSKQLRVEEKYYCGNPLYFKEYHYYTRLDSSICGLIMVVDFTKKYQNQRGSHYYEELMDTTYYASPAKKSYWYRKSKSKWKLERIRI